ncbi:hypothetical protein D3C80_1567060 [compost metagenome]
MAGAELDGFHGRGDAGIAREHDDQRIGVVLVQHLYAVEPGGIAGEFQVHDRIAGAVALQQHFHLFGAGRAQHLVAAPLERAGQRARECRIVFNQQQQACVHGLFLLA